MFNQDLYDAIVTLLPDTYKGKDNWIATSKLEEALKDPEQHREHYEYVCFQVHKALCNKYTKSSFENCDNGVFSMVFTEETKEVYYGDGDLYFTSAVESSYEKSILQALLNAYKKGDI